MAFPSELSDLKDKIYDFIRENGETAFNDIVGHLGIVRDTPRRVKRYMQIDACLFALLDEQKIKRLENYIYFANME